MLPHTPAYRGRLIELRVEKIIRRNVGENVFERTSRISMKQLIISKDFCLSDLQLFPAHERFLLRSILSSSFAISLQRTNVRGFKSRIHGANIFSSSFISFGDYYSFQCISTRKCYSIFHSISPIPSKISVPSAACPIFATPYIGTSE